jgi:hypothetical protein
MTDAGVCVSGGKSVKRVKMLEIKEKVRKSLTEMWKRSGTLTIRGRCWKAEVTVTVTVTVETCEKSVKGLVQTLFTFQVYKSFSYFIKV